MFHGGALRRQTRQVPAHEGLEASLILFLGRQSDHLLTVKDLTVQVVLQALPRLVPDRQRPSLLQVGDGLPER